MTAVAPGRSAVLEPTLARAKAQNLGKWAVALALLGLGAVYVVFPSSYLPWSSQNAETWGTVTEVGIGDFGGAPMCDPRVNYTVDERTYLARPSSSSDPCPWDVGDAVRVRYDPTHPSSADVPMTGFAFWFTLLLPIVLFLGAVVCAAAALVSLIVVAARRRMRRGVAS